MKATVRGYRWHGMLVVSPKAGDNDPVQVFHKLFSADEHLEQRQAAIAEKRSVLDAVVSEAKRVQCGLSREDSEKLDEYFQGIRDIEMRLSKDEAWLDVPKAKAPLGEPEPGLKGKAKLRLCRISLLRRCRLTRLDR